MAGGERVWVRVGREETVWVVMGVRLWQCFRYIFNGRVGARVEGGGASRPRGGGGGLRERNGALDACALCITGHIE